MNWSCNRCGTPFEEAKFYRKYKGRFEPTTRSGWSSFCRTCTREYKKQFWIANRSRICEAQKERYQRDRPQRLKYAAARRLARVVDLDSLVRHRRVVALGARDRYIHDRWLAWRRSASNRGFVWNLTEQDIHEMLLAQNGRCHYLGDELVLAPNSRSTLSLDRLDSSKDYERENVVLCGALVNKMKLDLSLGEFVEVVGRLYVALDKDRPRVG